MGLDDLTTDTRPAVTMRGQEGIHIVVVEMRERNGSITEPPLLPGDDTYYQVDLGGERRDYEANYERDVALLACVSLRVGTSEKYTGDLTVIALDAAIWMVDPLRHELVGEPWLNKVDMPEFVYADMLLMRGDRKFLAANVRNDVGNFLELTVPGEGVFQGGRRVLAHDDDVSSVLPPGSPLWEGETFIVRLVVFFIGTSFVDYIEVLCAPNGVLTNKTYRVGVHVPHELGTFTATSQDFKISGEFDDVVGASGEIRPLTRAARSCGVPNRLWWAALLDGLATRTADGYEIRDFR